MKGRNVFNSILSLMAAVLLLLPLRASASFTFKQATTGGTGIGDNAGGPSFTMSWNTTAGDSLFACIFFFAGTGKPFTVTPPSGQGWTLIASVHDTSGQSPNVYAYYIQNAPAQSGTYTWTFSPGGDGGGVFEEFSGGATSGLLGSYVTSSGPGTTTIPSGSLSDSSSSDLLICFGGQFIPGVNDTFSNPTNNFTLTANAQGADYNPIVQWGEAGFMTYRILSDAGGPYSTSTTSSLTAGYGTIFASFHAK